MFLNFTKSKKVKETYFERPNLYYRRALPSYHEEKCGKR